MQAGRGNGQRNGQWSGQGGGRRDRREQGSFKHLGRAIRYLGRYRRTTAIAYLSLFLSTAAQLVVPQMVQNILDAVGGAVTTLQSGVDPLQVRSAAEAALYWSIALTLIFAVIRGLFAFAQSYMSEKVSQELAFDFRNELFAKIQHLSFSYHDRNQTGQLMIRATDDVEKLRVFIGQGLLLALQALVLLVGSLVLLGITNWNLTLHVLPILPIALLLFMLFGAISQPLFGKVQAKLSALNTVLQENLAGIKVVKAFAREAQEQHRFNQAAEDLMHQQIVLARIFSFLFPVIFLIANLGQVVVIYFGGNQVIANTLTVGEWQKFSLYLVLVFFPIGQLGFIISQMSQASASATRIFEILDAKNEVADKPNAQPLPVVQGHVVFQDVTFRYFNSSDPVLSGVNLEAHPGETVALLGATGSGKTTIINLIPRFYDVSEGKVLIDGYDVREVQLESLRRQIGIVLQETNLFMGTIRDNIAFGRPEATDEEVIEAARAAAAHDFIMSFPQGYDTPVGERGATLSGGQKQRVAIARALLLDPHILILDDSTSSVDVATEVHIQRALDRLMQGRTSFVIAQRISTVLNADQILVMDKGQIVAHGKHSDLLETNPLYAEIYRSQLVEDAAPDLNREPATSPIEQVAGS
jgi:ATP-binding cassette, subfamily B, multidrug efflux pump